ARGNARVVDRVGLRLGLGHLHRDLWRVVAKTLVRPDWSRGTAFNGAGQADLPADQRRIQQLLGLVGLGGWHRAEIATQWVGSASDQVKPRHWRREILHAKLWTGRCAGG